MPSDIPKARDIINEVWDGTRPINDLGLALGLMVRDDYLRQAPVKHSRVTKEIRDAVKRDLADPSLAKRSRDDIGRRHNIDGGRVTEIHQGKYDKL